MYNHFLVTIASTYLRHIRVVIIIVVVIVVVVITIIMSIVRGLVTRASGLLLTVERICNSGQVSATHFSAIHCRG